MYNFKTMNDEELLAKLEVLEHELLNMRQVENAAEMYDEAAACREEIDLRGIKENG